MLFGMHLAPFILWTCFFVIEAVDGHCGYELPTPLFWWHEFDPASFHFWHHCSNLGNYGSMFLPLDILLGTVDPGFVKFVARGELVGTHAKAFKWLYHKMPWSRRAEDMRGFKPAPASPAVPTAAR